MRITKIIFVLAVLLIPTLASAKGWLADIGDQIGREMVSNATGVDVRRQTGAQDSGSDQESSSGGLASGTRTLNCGCYGNVQAGATRQNTQCSSGVDAVVLCNGRCSGGGRPWAAVCQ
ncbi:MAG TPA: hypothetical protein VJ550_03820 [Geomonas sp.]|nr:hypothetical protein [Geomonas sp.]